MLPPVATPKPTVDRLVSYNSLGKPEAEAGLPPDIPWTSLGAADMIRATLVGIVFCLLPGQSIAALDASIAKPEHPRPDAMREFWANLNGAWEFRFDAAGEG